MHPSITPPGTGRTASSHSKSRRVHCGFALCTLRRGLDTGYFASAKFRDDRSMRRQMTLQGLAVTVQVLDLGVPLHSTFFSSARYQKR